LSRSLTVVLEDQGTAYEICGVHDTNLRKIEEQVDARVFCHGNQLYLESEDAAKQKLFLQIIEELKSHLRQGHSPDPTLIQAIHASITEGRPEDVDALHSNSIDIPGGIKVFPRGHRQAQYIRGMDEHDISFSVGPAGTGKTYLAVAHALSEILRHNKRRLILTRPVVEAGESLGFLPGDLTQKISPYLRPLYDAMDSLIDFEVVSRLEENRVIEIAPLAYMRGRSLKDSYIILDEAQNTTKEQMKMFLTRIGERSKAVITGDATQIDLPAKARSGLLHVMKVLKPISEIHFTYFDARDVVRHPLVQKIITAYESESD
jgi:phosphate starvation-inducible protein PhoH and related proteins